jgi:Flp pilus assembly protein TadB
MRRSGKTDKRTPWDVLAQAAAVFAILLPVVGVGVRAVAFGLSGTVPWWVAVERPPIDLALTGFVATVPALVIGLLAYPVAREFGPRLARLDRVRAERRRVHSLAYQLRLDADALKATYQSRFEALGARTESLSARDYDEVRAEIEAELASTENEFKSDSDALTSRIGGLEHDAKRTERLARAVGAGIPGWAMAKMPGWTSRIPRGLSRVLLGIEVLGVLCYLVAFAWFPGNWLVLLGTSVGMAWIFRLAYAKDRLTFAEVLPPLVLVLAMSAVGSGVQTTGVDAAATTFESGGPASGLYVEVGRADAVVYLVECPSRQVLAVRADLIRLEEIPRPTANTRASLLDVLRGGALRFGYQINCPSN